MDVIFTYEDGSQALSHYGVKGMKWGVRKQRAVSSNTKRMKLASRLSSMGGNVKRRVAAIDKKKAAKSAIKFGAGMVISIGMVAAVGAAAGAVMSATAGSAVTQAAANLGRAAIGSISLGSVATKTVAGIAGAPIKKRVNAGIDKAFDKIK